MKLFSYSLATIMLAAIPAAAAPKLPTFDAAAHRYTLKQYESTYGNERLAKIQQINDRMFGIQNKAKRINERPADEIVVGSQDTGTLETPWGETWYYTAEYEYNYVVHNEYYTEKFLKAYTYNIFDSQMKPVGSLHDWMRYGEDEKKVPLVDLVPLVTRNFFNNDDKYEIMVSLCINTNTPGIMHFRSEIYSLNGNKESMTVGEETRTVDTPLFNINGLLGDVLHAPTPSNAENYYLTFYEEHPAYIPVYPTEYPEGATEDEINAIYWEKVCEANIDYYTLTKVPGADNLTEVFRKNIMIQKLPGDQESSMPLITFVHNGTPYILTQEYKETLSNPYKEPHISPDFSMRESNSLVVDLYKFEGATSSLVKSTEIPFVKDPTDGVFYTWYAVGDFRYRNDIDFDHFNTGDLPAYYVTKKNFFLSEDELSSYYVYDTNGTLLRTIFENAESYSTLSDIEGFDTQVNFVNTIGGEWNFNFVDLPSGQLRLTQCWKMDMGDDLDPERITSNIDRAPYGTSYAYVAEMRVPSVDEFENNYMRVLWFDRRANIIDINEINVGEKINYGLIFIDGMTLDPKFFDNDDEREYMMLVKRSIEEGSSASNEELMICKPVSEANPLGKTIFHAGPHDEYGKINTIVPIGGNPNALSITYLHPETGMYTRQLFHLPLNSSAVEEIEMGSATSSIRFEGGVIYAEGETIRVFNTQGIEVAEGVNTLDTASLPSALYIISAGQKTIKVVK